MIDSSDVVNEIANSPYAKWLENGLRTIAPLKPSAISLCAITPSKRVLTGYFNCSPEDKATIALHVYTEGIIDALKSRGVVLNDEANDESD